MSEVAPRASQRDFAIVSFFATVAFATLTFGAVAGAQRIAALGGIFLLAAVAIRRPTLPWSRVLLVLLLVILFIPIRRYRIPGDCRPARAVPRVGRPDRPGLAGLVARRSSRPASAKWLRVGNRAHRRGDDRLDRLQSGSSRRAAADRAEGADLLPQFHRCLLSRRERGRLSSRAGRARQDTRRRRRCCRGSRRARGAGGLYTVHAARCSLPVPHARSELRGCNRPRWRQPSVWPGRASDRARGRAGHARSPCGLRGPYGELSLVAGGRGARRRRSLDRVADGRRDAARRRPRLPLAAPARDTAALAGLLPVLVITHFAVPGTLGSLKQAFLPENGLVAEQQALAGSCSSSGRVADLGPTLAEVGETVSGLRLRNTNNDRSGLECVHPRQPVVGDAPRRGRVRCACVVCCSLLCSAGLAVRRRTTTLRWDGCSSRSPQGSRPMPSACSRSTPSASSRSRSFFSSCLGSAPLRRRSGRVPQDAVPSPARPLRSSVRLSRSCSRKTSGQAHVPSRGAPRAHRERPSCG